MKDKIRWDLEIMMGSTTILSMVSGALLYKGLMSWNMLLMVYGLTMLILSWMILGMFINKIGQGRYVIHFHNIGVDKDVK